MNYISFTQTESFTRSLYNAPIPPLPDELPIEPAAFGLSKFSLNERDPISQTSFKELIEDQFSHKLDYFIVIDIDQNGFCHLNDGFNYLKNYWSYSHSQNVLSRGEIKDFAIFRLNVFDATQTPRFFCSKKGIDENKGYLKHIEAHYSEYREGLRANAFCDIAQEYGNGKCVFGQNEKESYAWYKRSALMFENPHAYACLSILKQRGCGTQLSLQKSFTYLQKAAEQTTDGQICYLFAELFEKGQGTDRDISQALAWYQKALDFGIQAAKSKVDDLSIN